MIIEIAKHQLRDSWKFILPILIGILFFYGIEYFGKVFRGEVIGSGDMQAPLIIWVEMAWGSAVIISFMIMKIANLKLYAQFNLTRKGAFLSVLLHLWGLVVMATVTIVSLAFLSQWLSNSAFAQLPILGLPTTVSNLFLRFLLHGSFITTFAYFILWFPAKRKENNVDNLWAVYIMTAGMYIVINGSENQSQWQINNLGYLSLITLSLILAYLFSRKAPLIF